jgi:hypothetical protein
MIMAKAPTTDRGTHRAETGAAVLSRLGYRFGEGRGDPRTVQHMLAKNRIERDHAATASRATGHNPKGRSWVMGEDTGARNPTEVNSTGIREHSRRTAFPGVRR